MAEGTDVSQPLNENSASSEASKPVEDEVEEKPKVAGGHFQILRCDSTLNKRY